MVTTLQLLSGAPQDDLQPGRGRAGTCEETGDDVMTVGARSTRHRTRHKPPSDVTVAVHQHLSSVVEPSDRWASTSAVAKATLPHLAETLPEQLLGVTSCVAQISVMTSTLTQLRPVRAELRPAGSAAGRCRPAGRCCAACSGGSPPRGPGWCTRPCSRTHTHY